MFYNWGVPFSVLDFLFRNILVCDILPSLYIYTLSLLYIIETIWIADMHVRHYLYITNTCIHRQKTECLKTAYPSPTKIEIYNVLSKIPSFISYGGNFPTLCKYCLPMYARFWVQQVGNQAIFITFYKTYINSSI